MAFRPEQNLTCPVCLDIFQDPVILQCCHSFCRACLQPCQTETMIRCPLCRRSFPQSDPPRNLALKNLCEAFLQERAQRPEMAALEEAMETDGSPRGVEMAGAALCGLHSEHLRLFCLDHQKPVCVVCLHSETHQNHSMKPIDEAARDYRAGLQKSLKPLREKHKLLTDIKANCDLRAQDLEDQAADTERQIKDVFSMLRDVLQKEEQARITALKAEKQQKSGVVMKKRETLSREIAALSDTISVTEDDLRAEDVPFLLNYNTTAERLQHFVPDVEELTPGALIDVNKHLNNLAFVVLNKIKDKIAPTFSSDSLRHSNLDTVVQNRTFQRGGQSRRPFSVALTANEAQKLESKLDRELVRELERELDRKLERELPPPPVTASIFPLDQLSAVPTNTATSGPGRATDLRLDKVRIPPAAAPPSAANTPNTASGTSRGLTSRYAIPTLPLAPPSGANTPSTVSGTSTGLTSRYAIPTLPAAPPSGANTPTTVSGTSTGLTSRYAIPTLPLAPPSGANTPSTVSGTSTGLTSRYAIPTLPAAPPSAANTPNTASGTSRGLTSRYAIPTLPAAPPSPANTPNTASSTVRGLTSRFEKLPSAAPSSAASANVANRKAEDSAALVSAVKWFDEKNKGPSTEGGQKKKEKRKFLGKPW